MSEQEETPEKVKKEETEIGAADSEEADIKPEVEDGIAMKSMSTEESETLESKNESNKDSKEESKDKNAGDQVDSTSNANSEDEEEELIDSDESDEPHHKRRRGNQFLDVEAEVDDDDDDDDDEAEAALLQKEFLADEGEEATGSAADDNAGRVKMDRSRERLDEADAQALAAEFKERYGRSSQAAARYMGAGGARVSQRLLLPSVNDPSIWGIHVKRGREKDIVRQLYARMFNMKTVEGVFSAFQRDDFVGYVYVEARRVDAVERILAGIPGIYVTAGKVLVPIAEYPDLLRPGQGKDQELKPGRYVRVRAGRYKGDLGIIDNIADNGLAVRVKLVPRLNYGRGSGTGGRGGSRSKTRAPQRLFSQYSASRYDPEHLTTARAERDYFVYRGEEYEGGYLLKDISAAHLTTDNVRPTLRELELFGVTSKPGVAGVSSGDSSSVPLTELKQSQRHAVEFLPGDSVVVTAGEETGMHGKVVAVSGDGKVAHVIFTNGKNSSRVEVPVTALRRVFIPGDHVTVVSGVHNGEAGMVVQVMSDKQLTLVSDQTGKDVTVFSDYVQRGASEFSGAESASKAAIAVAPESSTSASDAYELHQLVRLNAREVGIVVKLEPGAISVLLSDGRLMRVQADEIQTSVSVSRLTEKTTDSVGNEMKAGDVVREMAGLRRQGAVLHIYRGAVFVRSRDPQPRTAGVFVSDASEVRVLSAAKRSSQLGGLQLAPDVNLSGMNPGRVRAQQAEQAAVSAAAAATSRFHGRDPTVHQYVSVRKGPYKGKKGFVKDANGPMARVEMHNPAKITPIHKMDLLFEQRPGFYVGYEEFLASHGGGTGRTRRRGMGMSRGNPRGMPRGIPGDSNGDSRGLGREGSREHQQTSYGGASSWGGRTPAWGSGGKTPAWSSGSGSKTPGWNAANTGANGSGKASVWGPSGSKTPAWGSAGSKTPSWGTAGGKTPAWGAGAATAYGGATSYGNVTAYGGTTAYGNGTSSTHPSSGAPSAPWDAPTPAKSREDDYTPAE